ncbi:hypothetical protein EUX98_g5766 [Antrodiella citrinella]|uniref:Right handed beta helix domain-containing protein n=1 Tax=Antrodiella citrinella TaxID=2447956 RepID=A0A4S4MTB5_9APHY|nr:hypothetical protein EUX98_g5766 [Antrodiella citrinella]
MKFEHRKRSGESYGLVSRSSKLLARDDCVDANPANTLTDRLNTLLNSSGPGYVLDLCPSTQYLIQAPILFAAPDQEIRTLGEPFGDERATLVVNGPVSNGVGHTTAVDGTCGNCNGVRLRHVQINGTRLGAPPTGGGANIEMGGPNNGQLVEFVHSFDPRSWSCLHVAEGPFTCDNVTVQNNDIGPAGSDQFQQWADGISVSCQNSLVRNNTVNNPTDGGIVLFGSPGTVVENNTIFVETQTLLGGINMVDYEPWGGNYTNTIVRNNSIFGGFSTDTPTPGEEDGANQDDVIIKIGIAIGPRTWFGNQYGLNVSANGMVLNNQLSGAFGYGIAITSATNFTVSDNILVGNTSFIGASGPNCSSTATTPTPAPFVIQQNNTLASSIQTNFTPIADGDGMTCILPPDGGDFWPFGGNPANPIAGQSTSSSSGLSGGAKAGIAIGVIAGVILLAAAAWFIRKAALARAKPKVMPWDRVGYVRNKEEVTPQT